MIRAESVIDTRLTIAPQVTDRFKRDGFVHLKSVFSQAEIDYWRHLVAEVVRERNTESRPLESRDTYGKAFLQTMNLWEVDERVRSLVFSKRLASIACDLLEVDGVRLYHDQALFKEARGGHTPWHADQYYWPLASSRTVTAWLPLVDVPLEMGPLSFARGSHRFETGRTLAISDESETTLGELLARQGFEQVETAFEAGDVSFHLGWTYHRAGANHTDSERSVMTMIYMDQDMRLKTPENEHQSRDRSRWCPQVDVGEICDSRLNPVLARAR